MGNHHRSPSLGPTGTAAAGVGMSVVWEWSKRQWLETEDTPGSHSSASSLSSSSLAQQAVATGLVNIDEGDQEGRFMCLKNSSDKDQSSGNWRIKGQVLEDEDIAYKFTPKYVPRASQKVTLWAAGQGLPTVPINPCVEEPEQLGICGELFTVLGNAEVAVQEAVICPGSQEWGKEEEAEFNEGNLYHQPGD